jgi:hypothetical protein
MNSPAVYQGIQGTVVPAPHVSAPHSYAARDFFETIRDLIHRAGFHNESEVQSAISAVDGYEKHVIGGDLPHVASETDRAPVEDVTLRVPLQPGLPAVAPAQAIDYARLAAAIVAAQAAQAASGGVPSITDLPAVPAA